MARTLTAVAVAAVALVLAAPLNARVLDVVGPFLGRCPQALAVVGDILAFTLPSERAAYAPVDCLIGVFAWLAIPGAVGIAYHVFRRVR